MEEIYTTFEDIRRELAKDCEFFKNYTRKRIVSHLFIAAIRRGEVWEDTQVESINHHNTEDYIQAVFCAIIRKLKRKLRRPNIINPRVLIILAIRDEVPRCKLLPTIPSIAAEPYHESQEYKGEISEEIWQLIDSICDEDTSIFAYHMLRGLLAGDIVPARPEEIAKIMGISDRKAFRLLANLRTHYLRKI